MRSNKDLKQLNSDGTVTPPPLYKHCLSVITNDGTLQYMFAFVIYSYDAKQYTAIDAVTIVRHLSGNYEYAHGTYYNAGKVDVVAICSNAAGKTSVKLLASNNVTYVCNLTSTSIIDAVIKI